MDVDTLLGADRQLQILQRHGGISASSTRRLFLFSFKATLYLMKHPLHIESNFCHCIGCSFRPESTFWGNNPIQTRYTQRAGRGSSESLPRNKELHPAMMIHLLLSENDPQNWKHALDSNCLSEGLVLSCRLKYKIMGRGENHKKYCTYENNNKTKHNGVQLLLKRCSIRGRSGFERLNSPAATICQCLRTCNTGCAKIRFKLSQR